MIWKEHTGGLLAFMSLFSGAMYIAIGAVLLGVLYYFDVGARFWTPVMLIYVVGVLSQQLTYSTGAINVQIQVSSEYLLDRLTPQSVAQGAIDD